MPITLYDAFVPTCLQQLGAVANLLDKAEAHCEAEGWAPARIINARLAPDMFDFAYQVKSCHTHSAYAIDRVKSGTFEPERSEPPQDFAGLKAKIADAIAKLRAIDPVEMEALIGADAEFRYRDWHMPFTAENFLLSFSQPNFQFHAASTYAILRMLGVKVGKMDYLGAMRMKEA
ncbi:DUF1993 domain-containing protein [Croceicoccus ponticola]|uniref:DUF1993 domain-containing protein n=1 Tax=Croceicoccus ponticola TaxID=2217664 RepID=A0A437GVR6_9SPHN|nr:DUF1993 domain-containing protein [Croceicoccus ponticola]RVQ65975.1 DUF1993 domain-containing protein [Croceicoccus ponticola]